MSDILKLDHVGIAVKDLNGAIEVYERLGLKVAHQETVAAQKVHTATLPLGDTKLELLEPTVPDSAVGKFLAANGEGVHHLALHVDNLEEKLRELQEQGFRLIDETPRGGIGGTRVAFLHPKGTLGTLIELVEHSNDSDHKGE